MVSKFNVWDRFMEDVLPVLEAASKRKWTWYRNDRCKYIEVRIDMRDGSCIIKDRHGNRITPEELARQMGGKK